MDLYIYMYIYIVQVYKVQVYILRYLCSICAVTLYQYSLIIPSIDSRKAMGH